MFGMFDKDREIGLQMQDWVASDTPFILYDVTGPIDVQLPGGPAKKTTLKVAKLDQPAETFDVTTLASSIASKAPDVDREKELPAVVMWTTVEPTATSYNQRPVVLRFLKLYGRAPEVLPTGSLAGLSDEALAAAGGEGATVS